MAQVTSKKNDAFWYSAVAFEENALSYLVNVKLLYCHLILMQLERVK